MQVDVASHIARRIEGTVGGEKIQNKVNDYNFALAGMSVIIIIMLDIGLFHGAPEHSVFSPSHPSAASDSIRVVRPPCLRTPYTTFSRPWPPFEDSSTPPFIGPATDMASPTPLQRTNSLSNVGDVVEC
ncbi:hypothetical protein MSG28_009789 [Choristoneura fumiferana]|uniref:Uncharacterized protein n=1 Tax=Choristoneura fumiferana TaxID=7141 RepID=A0ACC0JCU6_CHOFU|nr:hypothetical protein MSG28_009789 [Choristoneura fumiferana]